MLAKLSKFDKFLFFILFLQALVNFIGALGPELAFDALWYHLTLPKLFIEQGKIFVPGGLLYYSAMPKLIELFYVPAIYIGGEILAKVVHYLFGIGTLAVLYRLSRIFLSKTGSLLVLVVFYSNLVVAWQSITAYIDLGRTFFEVLAFYFFIYYFKKNKESDLIKSSIFLGFAISSKLLTLGSLIVFTIIFFLNRIKFLIILRTVLIAMLIPSPWFIYSYFVTGNPIYPFFNNIYKVEPSANFSNILNFIHSQDPISPIYLMMLPLVFVYWPKFTRLTKIVGIYSAFTFLFWFVTPQTGGGRFVMPYLPAYSLLVVITLFLLKEKLLKKIIILVILILAFVTFVYRGAANAKYLPVLLGIESKREFLSRNLNFDFGDFYDVDGYFERNIKPTDRVLIYGTHNLYYVDFPFIHESWRKRSDVFNYVMIQNERLPEEFKKWPKVYSNDKTNVRLYKQPRTDN